MSALQIARYGVYNPSPMMAKEFTRMVKQTNVSHDEIAKVLAYDPAAGAFTWRVSVGTRAKAGSRAGVWQRMQNGKDYLSITYQGRKMQAAQVAWLLQTGEWPDRTLFFIDDDTTNLKFSNLKLADHKSIKFTDETGKTKYRMTLEQIRHYGLQRFYGLTLTQYAEMHAKQGGVCAICGKAETAKVPGRKGSRTDRAMVRDLSVDHDHTTGAVRELLCNSCNHILGEVNDDASVLRAAADYLDRHNTKEVSNVSPKPNGRP